MLFYRRFGFTPEAFIRTDFRCRSSVCRKLVPYVAQLVAPLVSIHVVGLPDPYRFPYESAIWLFMVALWNRADHIYFHAVFCSLFFLFLFLA